MTSSSDNISIPQLNKLEKQIIMAILIAIMEADGIIDPRETAYLDEIITVFRLTPEDMDQIYEADFNQMAAHFRTFSADKKRYGIELFNGMALSDAYADPRELNIIAALGE